MQRKLNYNEKNKINEICKSEITLGTSYASIAKIIAPVFTMLLFLFLYFEISYGSIWIYLAIGFMISIIEVFEISKLQKPYFSIKSNDYSCIESEMLSSRKALIDNPQNLIPRPVLEKTVRPGEVRYYNYYVTVNIEGNIKEIEYKGKSFDYLTIGEPMIIINLKNNNYICFSNKELND